MNDQQQSRADALTDEHIATLKLAARAVTPQDIDGAERIESRPDGSYITCPACEGEGCIPFESDYCNYDHVAIGVQFYGVGTEPGAAEAYFRAAKPATILALLDRLERAESALAAPPVEQPAAAPADERAALPQIPDLVKATAWLTMCLRTELSRLDDTTHKALDEVEAQLSCVRAITNGAIDYEAMVPARAAASPAAEEDPYNTWWKETLKHGHANGPWSATNVNRYRAIPDGWMLVPKHHGTKPLAELIIAASLACVENRLMEDDDRHELAQFADQLQSMPSEATVTTTRPRWTRNEIDGLLDDADRLSRHPGKASGTIFDCACVIRELLAAPQPAQADAPLRIEALRKGLFEARDAMRVMSNWVKKSDPAGHSWAVRMMDRASAVLNGEADAAQADAPAEARAKSISDEMMDLADRLGSEWKDGDPRAWQHLLVYAPAEAFPYQKTFNAIAAATSVEGGHVSISVKAFRDAFGGAVAEAREPIAWVTDDDRAITAAQKQRALADGGATASSVRPYSIPCYAVSAPADAGEARLTDAARDMLAERRRQVEAEGWTPEHDDQYQHGAIALAAACYAANAGGVAWADPLPSFWPWMHNWWKPTTPRRDLVKAGALILAELERLDRAALLNGADHDQ